MTNKVKPAVAATVVTLNDSAEFPATRGIIISTAGSLKVTFPDGSTAVLPALQAGVIHAVSCTSVWSTGSDAVGPVALMY